ncbi:MAG: GNAT family N-acetyltransferase [Epsilonproteobacteria bacterium]|nr:GNAT family N-acetyltransferase [Campylobacterota bacterium]
MITIHKAELQDIPILCELLHILFSQEVEFVPDQTKQEKALCQIIESEIVGDIFVAKVEGKIVAMVNLLYTLSTALGGKVALLEDMIVHPAYQGRGIGSTLIDETMREAQKAGCQRITLLSDDDNHSAHRFYQKSGFSPSSMKSFRNLLS